MENCRQLLQVSPSIFVGTVRAMKGASPANSMPLVIACS